MMMLAVQVHRAGVAEHLQQRALPAEQAGQGDDERGHPEPRDDEAVEEPDQGCRRCCPTRSRRARGLRHFGEKKLYGKTMIGVIRSTFVVDADGAISTALYGVKATGHVARLRAEVGA